MVPSKHNTQVHPTWLLCYYGMIGITMVAGSAGMEAKNDVDTSPQSDSPQPKTPAIDLSKIPDHIKALRDLSEAIDLRGDTLYQDEELLIKGCKQNKHDVFQFGCPECKAAMLALRAERCSVLETAADALSKVNSHDDLSLLNVHGKIKRQHLECLWWMQIPKGPANAALTCAMKAAEVA